MWIDSMLRGTDTAPLDRVIQFTETRHQLLANNIANIDTPGYQMRDLSVQKFQQDLQKAIENRTVTCEEQSSVSSAKTDFNQYLLFHDRNNRSIEKQVTQMTENAVLHNTAVELLRSRYTLLEKAISLKP